MHWQDVRFITSHARGLQFLPKRALFFMEIYDEKYAVDKDEI
jgi:hypothetical protein